MKCFVFCLLLGWAIISAGELLGNRNVDLKINGEQLTGKGFALPNIRLCVVCFTPVRSAPFVLATTKNHKF